MSPPFSLDGVDPHESRSQPYGLGSSAQLFAATHAAAAFDSSCATMGLSAQSSGGGSERDAHSSSLLGVSDDAPDFASSALHPPSRLRLSSGALVGGLSMLNSPHLAAQSTPASPSISAAHGHARMSSITGMMPPAVSMPATAAMHSSAAAAAAPAPVAMDPATVDYSQLAFAWMAQNPAAVASLMAAAAAAAAATVPQLATQTSQQPMPPMLAAPMQPAPVTLKQRPPKPPTKRQLAKAAAAAASTTAATAAAAAEVGSTLAKTDAPAAAASASSSSAAAAPRPLVTPLQLPPRSVPVVSTAIHAAAAASAAAVSSPAASPTGSPSASSEISIMRAYQHHQSQIASFLKHFRELPQPLRVEAFKHPPPYVDAHTILTALMSLSIESQVDLINQLPRPLQASLVKSLTKKERNRLADALRKKSAAEIAAENGGVQPYFDDDAADAFCAPLPAQYCERAAAIAAEESQDRRQARHRSKSGGTEAHAKPTFTLSVRGASVETCLDRSLNPRTHFLPVIQQMMLSFGDVHFVDSAAAAAGSNPHGFVRSGDTLSWPSLYTAMRIQEAVEEFVRCFLPKLKPGRAGLDTMIRLFPKQARVYFKWKDMNQRAKTQQQQAALEAEGDEASDMMGSEQSDEEDQRPNMSQRKAHKRKRKSEKQPKAEEPASASTRRAAAAAAPPAKRGRKRGASAAGSSSDSDDPDFEAPTGRGRGRGRGRGGRGGRSSATRGRGGKRSTSSVSMFDSDHSNRDEESSDASDEWDSDASSSESEGSESASEAAAQQEEPEPDPEAEAASEDESDPELEDVEDILETAPDATEDSVEGEEHKDGAPAGSSSASADDASAADAAVPAKSTAYDIFFPSLDLHLGPFHRLSKQTALSAPMSESHYYQFVRCREASFVPMGRSVQFCRWLQVPSSMHKAAIQFLAYLAWDRIGMIVEVCAALRENSRHARSNLPFTLYEANTALQMLDTHPLTSLEHIRRPPGSEAKLKQLLLKYYQSLGMTNMPAEIKMPKREPIRTPVATAAAAAAAPSAPKPVPSSPTPPAPMTLGQPMLKCEPMPPVKSDEAAAAAAAASASSVPPSVPALEAPLQVVTATAVGPVLKLRYSDADFARLFALAESLQWKYRATDPRILAFLEDASTWIDSKQIQKWMTQNKPQHLVKKRMGHKGQAQHAQQQQENDQAESEEQDASMERTHDTDQHNIG